VRRVRTRRDPTTLAALTADPQNRRAHNERNLALIGQALTEVGAARSIVIDEDHLILAGNGVAQAAQAVGLTKLRVIEASGDEVIAVRRRGLTDAQKRALALYDNRTAELATWNLEQLLADQQAGLDLASYWDAAELAALLHANGAPKAGLTDPDAVPEVRATEIQRGDLFELGAHRLLCGDSTVAADVARVMGDEKAAACVTDLPYNIGKDYGIWDDSLTDKEFWGRVIPAWLTGIVSASARPAHFVTTFSERGMIPLIDIARQAGFEHRHTGVWHNPTRLAGSHPGQWPFCWEPVLDFSLGGWVKLANGNGVGRSDVWVLDSPIGSKKDDDYHPAEKPVKLYCDLLELVTKPNGIVYEPCDGSGTTVMACEQQRRRCFGVEINPSYCQVTLDRWEQFTGNRAQKVGEAVRPPVTHGSVTRERREKKARPSRPSPAGRRRRAARAGQ